MTVALKAGKIIDVVANGNAGHTDFEDTMTASYAVEITDMGPIQNTGEGGEVKTVTFATLTGDTRAQIMVKAKDAVDAAILAG